MNGALRHDPEPEPAVARPDRARQLRDLGPPRLGAVARHHPDRAPDGGPVLAVPRCDGARRLGGPATAGRRASALRARRTDRADRAGRAARGPSGPAGSPIARRTAHVEVTGDRALAAQRIREALRCSARFRDPRTALRRRARCRGYSVHGRSRRDPQGPLAARPAVRPGRQRVHVSARD